MISSKRISGLGSVAVFWFAAMVGVVSGCGGGGSISTVTAPGATLSVTSMTFASSNVPQVTTLTNTGNGSLTISGVTLGGTNAADFSVSGNTCGTSLAASASCSISVTFVPAVAGSFTATLTVADNAPGSPQVVSLSGTGGVPALSFTLGTGVVTTVPFGQDLVGSVYAVQVYAMNTGTGSLVLGTATIGGTSASAFPLTANNCSGTTLAPAASCAMTVTFNPTAVGSLTGTLSVASNAATTAVLSLTGSAVTEPNSCTTNMTTSPVQTPPTANYAGTGFTGKVLAGTTPVSGSAVTIYAAGLTGNGSTPTTMYSTTTNSAGSFTVPASFTCPYSNSVLYAVARGGSVGTNAANAGIVLAGVLGACNSLTGSPSFTINEVTTAATAWSMAQFMAAGGKLGSSATNGRGIVLAAGTFANLVSIGAGTAPGLYFPATGTAPSAKIYQAANLLNACTASSGASSTACTQLFSLTAASGVTPTNTLDAVLNVVKNPGTNVAALYTLSATSTAFTPSLTKAPTDWTLFVTYAGGGMNDPSAVSIDSTGKVWVANYFSVASLFSNTGAPVFASGITGDNLYNSYGAGVDVNDDVWITNEQSAYGYNTGLGTVSVLNGAGASVATYSAGGLNFPIAVAFDTNGDSWIVDYGNSHVTVTTNGGTPLSGSAGYTTGQYVFPVAMTTDNKCNGYIADQSSNTITFTSADGGTYGSYIMGGGPSGIAVDASNNIWTANYYGDSVGLLNSSGAVLSGANGFTGGGIDHPQGIAVDGAGTVWVANYRAPSGQNSSLSELAGASSGSTGTAISPSTGWGQDAAMLEPFAVAIDASGNLWVSNFGSNTLTEFVGMAVPVKTPLLGTARVP